MVSKATAALAALHVLAAGSAGAQLPTAAVTGRERLVEITRDTALAGAPTRWPLGALAPGTRRPLDAARVDVRVWAPDVLLTWNSAIPFSLNDGALWAGRGRNLAVTQVVSATRATRAGIIELIIAPTLTYSENLPYQVIPDSSPGRSQYASRFHRPGRVSADLPLRFGDRHLLRLDPGQTTLALHAPRLSAGLSTANEVWGPGLRNQLVLSGQASGIPRVFVETAPLRTGAGSLRARLFGGALTESLFFDNSSDNDIRSASGLLVELRTGFDSNLVVGVERLVVRPAGRAAAAAAIGGALDALIRWEGIAAPGDVRDDGLPDQGSDQMTALFGRWVFPAAGFEAWTELAWMDVPRSIGDLFTAPHGSGGYTVGVQWASRQRAGRYLRLQGEATYLEQSRVLSDEPAPDYYSGRAAQQGFTQRGQVLGAAVGPGGSSQFLAVDLLARRWDAGVYVGRIRWENDALYRQLVPTLFMHDVTVFAGVRGGYGTRLADVSTDLTLGYRYNYLFQNGYAQPGGDSFRTVDVRNATVKLAITPR